MRKVTYDATTAMKEGHDFRRGNTEVVHTDRSTALYLHGHRIVEVNDKGSLYVNMHGYGTATTRERVNGVLERGGYRVRVKQRDYEQVLVGTSDGQRKRLPYPYMFVIDSDHRVSFADGTVWMPDGRIVSPGEKVPS